MSEITKNHCQLNIAEEENQTVAYKLQKQPSSRNICGREYGGVPAGCRNTTEWVVDWVNGSLTVGFCSECFQKNENDPMSGMRVQFNSGFYLPDCDGERRLVIHLDSQIADRISPKAENCSRCGRCGDMYVISVDREVAGETLCYWCVANEHPDDKFRNVGYVAKDEFTLLCEVLY